MPEITQAILKKAANAVGSVELLDSIYNLMIVRDTLESSEWLKLMEVLTTPAISDMEAIHNLANRAAL
jgi:hypothetical protein